MRGMRLLVAGAIILTSSGSAMATENATAPEKKQTEFAQLPAGNLGGLAVRLQADGTLVGTIGYIDPNQLELVPIPGFEYRFVQNRQTIARGVSGQEGRIVVRGLSPLAVYSLVGRGEFEGQRWMVATGISIFPAEGAATPATNASASADKGPRTRWATAKRRYFSALEQFAQSELACGCCPEGDVGGFGGSAGFLDGGLLGGGPGGGAGGGGGFPGGLAAVAALAALATAGEEQAASPFRIRN